MCYLQCFLFAAVALLSVVGLAAYRAWGTVRHTQSYNLLPTTTTITITRRKAMMTKTTTITRILSLENYWKTWKNVSWHKTHNNNRHLPPSSLFNHSNKFWCRRTPSARSIATLQFIWLFERSWPFCHTSVTMQKIHFSIA